MGCLVRRRCSRSAYSTWNVIRHRSTVYGRFVVIRKACIKFKWIWSGMWWWTVTHVVVPESFWWCNWWRCSCMLWWPLGHRLRVRTLWWCIWHGAVDKFTSIKMETCANALKVNKLGITNNLGTFDLLSEPDSESEHARWPFTCLNHVSVNVIMPENEWN